MQKIKSIQTKLFIYIVVFFLIAAFLTMGINTVFFGKIYMGEKQKELVHATDEIVALLESEESFRGSELEQKFIMANTSFFVMDQEETIILNNFETVRGVSKRLIDMALGKKNGNIENKSSGMKVDNIDENFRRIINPAQQINFLEYKEEVSNIKITTIIPIQSIDDSIRIANDLMRYVILFGMFLSLIAAFFISRKFTKPITKLKDAASELSKLNFISKIDVKTGDELEELGNTMEFMANELEKNILELNIANGNLLGEIKTLEKVEKMRREFVGSASHELKTPIALIDGYATALIDGVAENKEAEENYCNIIKKETEKMQKLVENMLKLSKLQSELVFLENSTFDISESIDELLYRLKDYFEHNEYKINIIKEDITKVLGDRHNIDIVLENYLMNAFKYSDERKLLELEVIERDNEIEVVIKNSGEKLSDEDIEKVWDSFYRADKSGSRKLGGTGLGLSIVKTIINLHGKEFGYRYDEVKQMTEFWFTLDREKK